MNNNFNIPAINAVLLLKDRKVFYGRGIGKKGITIGELCFNTSMSGYQEILSDPSYYGQIINFTFPHIGIVGCNIQDEEHLKPQAKGLIIKNDINNHSNFRAQENLSDWLIKHHITGICDVDTREITNYIRDKGHLNALICYGDSLEQLDIDNLVHILDSSPYLNGEDLAGKVSTVKAYNWKDGEWNKESKKVKHKIVAIDYGAKHNILRCLVSRGAEVRVVPANTSFEEIMAYEPDGIFLSNGPGDPQQTYKYASNYLPKLVASGKPIFGICLGHQLLALAIGAKTKKLNKGHRGANHPVINLITNKVEITSQNHGFEVDESTLPTNSVVTHRSLFDQTNEGFELTDKPVFSVQYHPESSPGPHDSKYLFDKFFDLIAKI